MKLKIENIRLDQMIGILDKLRLKGMQSIYRTRLSQQLSKEISRVAEEEKIIRKELCHLDKNGDPIVKEDGKLDVKNLEEFNKTMGEFYGEQVIISGDDVQEMLNSIKSSLENSEIEWDSGEAYAFEYLYSAFEENEE